MAGTYKRRKNGRWRCEIMINGVRVSSTHDRKEEAQKWAARQLLAESSERTYQYSLDELSERYEAEITGKKKGARWEAIRLKAMRRDFPELFAMKLRKIRPIHIEQWATEREKTVKGSTVNRDMTLLSAMFQQGRRWEWCETSPTTLAKKPSDPPPRDRRVTEMEAALICAALGYSESEPVTQVSHRVAVAFLLCIETAMRRGEISQITESDIDLKNKVITLRAEITKANASRQVPLTPKAIKLIKSIPASKRTKNQWLGCYAPSISTLFKRAVANTGIKNLVFHDSRHEATTRLAKQFHVLDLARITGHKDIKFLLTYYNRSAADMANDFVG